MAIRNVGNNSIGNNLTNPDRPNDNDNRNINPNNDAAQTTNTPDAATVQEAVPATAETPIATPLKLATANVANNAPTAKSLENRSLGQTLRASLDAKLNKPDGNNSALTATNTTDQTDQATVKTRSAPLSKVGRDFQPAINNLLRSTGKFSNAAERYNSFMQNKLSAVRDSAATFLKAAQAAQSRLIQGRNNNAAQELPAALLGEVDKLLQQLQNVTRMMPTATNNLTGNVNRALRAINHSVQAFEKATQKMANGDARMVTMANLAFNQATATPGNVRAMWNDYTQQMDAAVIPLANQATQVATVQSFSLKSAAQSIWSGIKSAAQELAEKAYNFTYDIRETAGSAIDEYLGPILRAVGTGFKDLFNSIFNPDKNPNGKPIQLSKLVRNTQDLRNTLTAAQSGNATALNKLKSTYGYSLATAPKPGQMWLAANYVAGDLKDGQVTATKFPNTPVTTKTQVNYDDPAYQKQVATNREKLGIPANGGKPTAVQLTLEGGGGKGKRYGQVLTEMYNLGVKPESVTGTSAGALVATLVAAGIDTRKVADVAKDPALKKFFDATFEGPGVLEGRELYRFLDQKLRDITGIKDRPVTFADLPIPLQLVTTKLADSQAPNDLTRLQDRIFVFSKDTTPNTPVAFAAVASAAIPAGFDPIEMVDVATGRTIRLADGGVVDNLPLGYQKNKNLPELAVQLNEPNINSGDPTDRGTPQPFPPGNLISDNPFGNAKIGLDLQAKAATSQRDFFDRINPPTNTFVLNVPTWNLQNFEQQNTTLQFEYDDKIDPALDKQTTTIAQSFFQQFLPQFGVAGARGTNLKTPPTTNEFNRTFTANGANWTATHTDGNDVVVFQSDTGKKYDIKIGNDRLRDWVADDRSFGDLGFRLRDVVVDFEKFLLFN